MPSKLTGQGGPGRGQGRKPKPKEEKYQQYPLKLPPDLIEWLEQNTTNRNGFIVEAIREKIKRI
jgi:hypothetical protein